MRPGCCLDVPAKYRLNPLTKPCGVLGVLTLQPQLAEPPLEFFSAGFPETGFIDDPFDFDTAGTAIGASAERRSNGVHGGAAIGGDVLNDLIDADLEAGADDGARILGRAGAPSSQKPKPCSRVGPDRRQLFAGATNSAPTSRPPWKQAKR